jgi:7-cyano-7-deazaguanine reductase
MKYLGVQASTMPVDPEAFELECVPNPEQANLYAARFTLPEFTSLCPVTGQPDFATIVIDYIPDQLLVESKALKLYATSFRNVGDFHEACSNKIADKVMAAAKPHMLRVNAFWYPRGGIPIDVFIERWQDKDPSPWDSGWRARLRNMMPYCDARDYRGR